MVTDRRCSDYIPIQSSVHNCAPLLFEITSKSREGVPTELSSDEKKEKARILAPPTTSAQWTMMKRSWTLPHLWSFHWKGSQRFRVYSRTGGESASIEAWVNEKKILEELEPVRADVGRRAEAILSLSD